MRKCGVIRTYTLTLEDGRKHMKRRCENKKLKEVQYKEEQKKVKNTILATYKHGHTHMRHIRYIRQSNSHVCIYFSVLTAINLRDVHVHIFVHVSIYHIHICLHMHMRVHTNTSG